MAKKTKKADRETIPCRSCGKDTPMMGTKLCDNCWEVERRTGKLPSELDALQASHDIKSENLEIVRKERDALLAEVEKWRNRAEELHRLVDEAADYIEGAESPGEAWDSLTTAWFGAIYEAGVARG